MSKLFNKKIISTIILAERKDTMPTEIIVENERLIYKISQSLYGAEKEDLIQAGFLGLTKAYKKYNPECGTKFSTYAYGYIYGEMYEAATGNRPVRVRKNELKLYKGVVKTKELLEAKFNRSVSYEEACAYTHVDYQTFMAILSALSATVNVEDTEVTMKSSEGNNVDDMIMLRDSMNSLTPLEKSVITNRYMEDMSQNETAKVLGLSQVKVSRLEKSSREKMKNYMAR